MQRTTSQPPNDYSGATLPDEHHRELFQVHASGYYDPSTDELHLREERDQ